MRDWRWRSGAGAAAVALGVVAACSVPPQKEYAYPAWGFAASFRSPPTQSETPASADGSAGRTITVEAVDAGRDELVHVIDGSGSTKTDDQALADAPGALARSVGGAVGSMTYTASGNVTGREFQLSRPGRPAARVRIFVAGKRLYEVIAQSTLGPDDRFVTEFLDSFRLTGR